MPTYTFKNKKTGKVWTEMITIAEMEEFLEKNKNVQQIIGAPNIVDPWNASRKKVPSGFRDVLTRIKKRHRGSNINTGNISET